MGRRSWYHDDKDHPWRAKSRNPEDKPANLEEGTPEYEEFQDMLNMPVAKDATVTCPTCDGEGVILAMWTRELGGKPRSCTTCLGKKVIEADHPLVNRKSSSSAPDEKPKSFDWSERLADIEIELPEKRTASVHDWAMIARKDQVEKANPQLSIKADSRPEESHKPKKEECAHADDCNCEFCRRGASAYYASPVKYAEQPVSLLQRVVGILIVAAMFSAVGYAIYWMVSL